MPIDLDRVKGICFDVDGTISDTDDAWVARLSHAFRPIRLFFKDQDPKNFSRWLVMVTESPMNLAYNWMDALSLDDNIARILERLQRRRKHAARSFWLMPGALNYSIHSHPDFRWLWSAPGITTPRTGSCINLISSTCSRKWLPRRPANTPSPILTPSCSPRTDDR